MVLYNIEYQNRLGQTFICKSLGLNEEDIMNDLVSVVGEIRVLNLYHVTEVHRISGVVRRQILENSLRKENTNKKIGRPRKYEIGD